MNNEETLAALRAAKDANDRRGDEIIARLKETVQKLDALIAGTLNECTDEPSVEYADWIAIWSDWEAIGNELRAVIPTAEG